MIKTLKIFIIMIAISFAVISHAAECFISKSCFAVIQPYMMEKTCYLYYHEIMMPPESQMVQTMGDDITLHPDVLHASFVKMMLEKKFVSLKRGTPIFSCEYDLEKVYNDIEGSRARGVNFPESACRGVVSKMIAVRPVNFKECYWVAVENVICHESKEWPYMGGSEVRIDEEDELGGR